MSYSEAVSRGYLRSPGAAAEFDADSVPCVRFATQVGNPLPQWFRTASVASRFMAPAIMVGYDSWLETLHTANSAATRLVIMTSPGYPCGMRATLNIDDEILETVRSIAG